ncbi:unnamed protein product [Effrenium voratum]|uniref:NmrA-like domain-containing protein n=1 Tax=Effrenium voratum TaxID=2562239 RepID=A0AA36N9N7_9DINO|nr:unnamed protein product [Effrenium voratum]CAJ1448307.1 unnamed protein product [Effrenium voratum]
MATQEARRRVVVPALCAATAATATAFVAGGAQHATPALRGNTRAGASASSASASSGLPSAVAAATMAPLALAALARRKHRAGVTARKATITASFETEPAVEEEESVPVKKTSVLVLGSTGTVGRQVVRQLLNAGYSVRCMLRNRADRPFSFLVDWGATVVEGSLSRPESLPSSLVGIHTVIDCATARPEEDVYDMDWEGKKRLIQCCAEMKIQRYVFCSIKDCDKFQTVPLMQIKHLTEKFLQQSGIRYTVLRISGLMQPLISQYAVSVLDDQKVWGDDGSMPGIAYIDSQDVSRMIASAMIKERTVGQTLTVTGPKVWSTNDVIKLCEELSGREADVNVVSNSQMQLTMAAAGCFDWTVDVAERLKFVEVNQSGGANTPMLMAEDTYKALGMEPTATRKLEEYIGEYYRRVFKKLTKGKYEAEPGELEKEKAEAEAKLKQALTEDTADDLPPGQPAEQEVTVAFQRDTAERLQKFFEDKVLAEMEDDKNAWFGWVPLAELFNGRAAMTGFSLGLFTEWATDTNVAKQIDLVLAIFSPPA